MATSNHGLAAMVAIDGDRIDGVRRARRASVARGGSLHCLCAGIALLLTLAARDSAWAAGLVYRCETPSGIEYRDIGCGMTPPMRLGRPVGSIDPLTEAERALLEQLHRDIAARASAGTRARVAPAATRPRACAPGQVACADRPVVAEKARKRPRKPRTVAVAAAAPRAMALGARPRRAAGASPRPHGDDAPAGPDAPATARRVAPGR